MTQLSRNTALDLLEVVRTGGVQGSKRTDGIIDLHCSDEAVAVGVNGQSRMPCHEFLSYVAAEAGVELSTKGGKKLLQLDAGVLGTVREQIEQALLVSVAV